MAAVGVRDHHLLQASGPWRPGPEDESATIGRPVGVADRRSGAVGRCVRRPLRKGERAARPSGRGWVPPAGGVLLEAERLDDGMPPQPRMPRPRRRGVVGPADDREPEMAAADGQAVRAGCRSGTRSASPSIAARRSAGSRREAAEPYTSPTISATSVSGRPTRYSTTASGPHLTSSSRSSARGSRRRRCRRWQPLSSTDQVDRGGRPFPAVGPARPDDDPEVEASNRCGSRSEGRSRQIDGLRTRSAVGRATRRRHQASLAPRPAALVGRSVG